MSEDKRDKIIYFLVVVIVALGARSFFKGDFSSAFKRDEDLKIIAEDSVSEENLEEITKGDAERKVYITGQITNPGVYIIGDDDRLEDLITMAGGLTERANNKNLNLAIKLEDQMKIYIPDIDEDIIEEDLNLSESTTGGGLVNINTASKEELMELPNVGEKRAEAIINYREENRFEKIEDIKKVTGIGDKFFEALKDLITI
ncbi:MAG: helix-hairpin-helix domain-containing protein [Anaerococcus sp.]|nr:helix-hairpin-helix domain-containing protein [Anaerococcus sp.]MDD7044418.1 helix-hairpin-helix domain-containing protein [Peptoniphilaceae bacterium]MDY2918774.1 helix-hairpin-helix domain-containing protein [Anaerococcus sp.]